MGLTYRDAGVNIDGGNSFVKRIAPIVKKTFTERVITGIGGFGALYDGSFPQMKEPVLVSGTDGVGTKLKIAQMMNRHETIGIDAVAMCVNDIVTSGAAPLFFLDYLSCGKLNEETMTSIVSGIAEGCLRAGCSLVGGETAEHPEVMEPGDYDIAGFAVGVVDKKDIINGASIIPGDRIIGLPSTGIHSNGYSLVRKLFFGLKNYSLDHVFAEDSRTLGDILLEPTAIYVKPVLELMKKVTVKGLVHVTGGGFYENIPRILPESTAVRIDRKSYDLPPVFSIMQREGSIDDREMYTTFNMGIGMIVFVKEEDGDRTMQSLAANGEKPVILGTVQENRGERVLID